MSVEDMAMFVSSANHFVARTVLFISYVINID